MTTPTSAVGYIRVSTHMQNEGDHALERQAEKIRRYCADHGIKLICIYDDICSAVDDFSVERRPSLSEAVRWATRDGACLVVPDATRLFRNVEVADRWFQTVTVPVFSVRDDKVLSRSEFLDAVSIGEQVAQASSEGTIKALEKKRASGVKLGSKSDRTAANAASKRARAQRSDSVVDAIAHVILEDPAYRDLSHRAFADLLNRRNLLTGWSRPWTAAGVKRQRKEAEERIQEWAEIDNLPDEVLLDMPKAAAQIEVVPPGDEYEELKKLPTFGMFSSGA